MNDIDQTALEIARAFIPVDVVGQQRANLQVAIIEAIKKHANPKTLADVQPGGMVRLGDQAERARFEAWAISRGWSIQRWAEGAQRYCNCDTERMWEAFQAALSAQPSPGGQGNAPLRVFSAGRWTYDGTGQSFSHEDMDAAAFVVYRDAALAARQPVGDQCPDDLAVDAFAAAMKAKMAAARAKGRGGWEDPAQCSADDLSSMLRDHVEKGDPRDVANFCMMLHQRGEAIAARQPVGEPVGYATYRDGRFGSWLFQTRAMAESHDSTAVAGGPANSEIVPLFRLPAQAVDLEELRRAVCVVGVVGQIDGHDVVRRNSVLDVIDTRRQRLADSQAVGE